MYHKCFHIRLKYIEGTSTLHLSWTYDESARIRRWLSPPPSLTFPHSALPLPPPIPPFASLQSPAVLLPSHSRRSLASALNLSVKIFFILRIFIIVEFLRQTSACLFGILFLCSSISRGGVYFVHFSSWCLFWRIFIVVDFSRASALWSRLHRASTQTHCIIPKSKELRISFFNLQKRQCWLNLKSESLSKRKWYDEGDQHKYLSNFKWWLLHHPQIPKDLPLQKSLCWQSLSIAVKEKMRVDGGEQHKYLLNYK